MILLFSFQTVPAWPNTRLETYIKNHHQNSLQQAIRLGKQLAGNNKPESQNSNKELYLNQFYTRYNGLMHHAHRTLKSKRYLLKTKRTNQKLKSLPNLNSKETKKLIRTVRKQWGYIVYIISIEKDIHRLYLEAVSTFITTNMAYRTDTDYPAWFNEPLPMLWSMAGFKSQ